MQLLLHDTVVMEIDVNIGMYTVLHEDLLPYSMRGAIQSTTGDEVFTTKYEQTQFRRQDMKNRNALQNWLAHRVLPLSRKNAKRLYQLFDFEQLQSNDQKERIAIICRAVSLTDDYWIKLSTDDKSWKEVSLRDNKLNEIVTQVALNGVSLSLQGDLTTPELSTNGAYAKAWVREADGLYLHKRGEDGNTESRIEVMVSKLLDKTNADHIRYEDGEFGGNYTCKCKCMSTEQLSVLPADDFGTYCNVNGLDFEKECLQIDANAVYRMWIVDYLISNRDRHALNWGFYVDNSTGRILRCHPLFDHNNAFDIEYMRNPDLNYQATSGRTMRQAADFAIRHTDFHFTDAITREDFITQRQYKSFMERAIELDIKTIPSTDASVLSGLEKF